MVSRQRTRPIWRLALACALFGAPACQRPDPGAAVRSASTDPVPAATARTAPVAPRGSSSASVLAPAPQSTSASALSPTPPSESTSASALGSARPRAVASSTPTDMAATPAPSSVLVLGDSLADESRGGGGFVRSLRASCPNVAFDNRAKGGFMVNQIRKRLETEVLPEQRGYSHAIVFGGVNDLYSDRTANRSLPRIERDLARIYSLLSERGVAVIAITVTPWGGFSRWYTPERGQKTLALNRWILEQQASGKVALALDAYPLLSCGEPERLCPELAAPFKDGLHFGKLGHQKLAKALADLAFPDCD